jgi:hypothetical protein
VLFHLLFYLYTTVCTDIFGIDSTIGRTSFRFSELLSKSTRELDFSSMQRSEQEIYNTWLTLYAHILNSYIMFFL